MLVVSVLPFDRIPEALQDTLPLPRTYDVDGQVELGSRHDGWTDSGGSSHVSPHEVHVCSRLDGDATTGGKRTMYHVNSKEGGQNRFPKKNV